MASTVRCDQRRSDGGVDHGHFAAASEQDRLRASSRSVGRRPGSTVEASIQRALELT
jgi:hypothetical protein